MRLDREVLMLRAQTRRDMFLADLRSTGKLPYRRYLGSPLRYAGGKSLAVGMVLELLPDRVNRLVSPFMGGGSVEIAVANELGIEVAAYDIFDVLCSYWQVQISHPQELESRQRKFPPNRDTFGRVKQVLTRHWKHGESLSLFDLAAHYYWNSNTSYGHAFSWLAFRHLFERR